MTPEGKVKAVVTKILSSFGVEIYKFMPVPSGYGPSSLDYILCVGGKFVAIETKAPGKKLTPRQVQTCKAIRDAGGIVFVIDDPSPIGTMELVEVLGWVLEMPRSKQAIQEWMKPWQKSKSASASKK